MFISALIIYRDLKLVLSAIPSPEFSPSALAVDTTNPGLMKRKCRQLRAAFLATVFEDYTPGAGPGGSFGAFGGSFFGCSLLGGSGFGAPGGGPGSFTGPPGGTPGSTIGGLGFGSVLMPSSSEFTLTLTAVMCGLSSGRFHRVRFPARCCLPE